MEVSSDFVKAYQLFNVTKIDEYFDILSESEKYLLCIICIDKHDHKRPIQEYNFIKISKYFNEILELQETGKTKNSELLKLIRLTNSELIDTENIVDENGVKLEMWDKHKIRDFKINKICKKE